MGRFTNDMTLLRTNIDSSREHRVAQKNARISGVKELMANFSSTRKREGLQDAHERATFIADNAKGVKRLLNNFHNFQQTMSRQNRKERVTFVNIVATQTRELLNGFHSSHKAMARHNAKIRAQFVANNSKCVGYFLAEASQDRAGAHAVFFGTVKKKASPLV